MIEKESRLFPRALIVEQTLKASPLTYLMTVVCLLLIEETLAILAVQSISSPVITSPESESQKISKHPTCLIKTFLLDSEAVKSLLAKGL